MCEWSPPTINLLLLNHPKEFRLQFEHLWPGYLEIQTAQVSHRDVYTLLFVKRLNQEIKANLEHLGSFSLPSKVLQLAYVPENVLFTTGLTVLSLDLEIIFRNLHDKSANVCVYIYFCVAPCDLFSLSVYDCISVRCLFLVHAKYQCRCVHKHLQQ